ncbi:MAG: hypothetical protein QOH90_40 [Actinomycetota bacterium]|jgi:hypothetical protein|nr:hypothetical protein [Actinomycetota bacterium]
MQDGHVIDAAPVRAYSPMGVFGIGRDNWTGKFWKSVEDHVAVGSTCAYTEPLIENSWSSSPKNHVMKR